MQLLRAVCLLSVLLVARSAKITLPTGVMHGVSGTGYDAYLGIPYALPPVGVLRWAPPMPNPKWNIGNATTFGAACPQSGTFYYPYTPQDENCLFLNIWVPDPFPTLGPVPVVIFIHGGSWSQGSGAQPLYWGDYVANTTGQIMVTFNYRLGALGFVSSPLLPGNYGIMDQQLAIKWVHSNIAAFGGDPGNITLRHVH
jgi:para-nitrobenzyl esterase